MMPPAEIKDEVDNLRIVMPWVGMFISLIWVRQIYFLGAFSEDYDFAWVHTMPTVLYYMAAVLEQLLDDQEAEAWWLSARNEDGWLGVFQLLSLVAIDPVSIIAAVFGAAGGETNIFYGGAMLGFMTFYWAVAIVRLVDLWLFGMPAYTVATCLAAFGVGQLLSLPDLWLALDASNPAPDMPGDVGVDILTPWRGLAVVSGIEFGFLAFLAPGVDGDFGDFL
jgi:hypothetical protein